MVSELEIFKTKELINREIELLEQFSELELSLQDCIYNRDWKGFEEVLKEMQPISEELVDVEERRNIAYDDLRIKATGREDTSFYQVVLGLPEEQREGFSKTYRKLKFTVLRLKGITEGMDSFVGSMTGTMREIMDDIFPYRKGNIYSSRGRTRQVNENPMVVNHHL